MAPVSSCRSTGDDILEKALDLRHLNKHKTILTLGAQTETESPVSNNPEDLAKTTPIGG